MSTRTHSGPITTPESWVGRTIDRRYALTALLGEGGMGAVYRARHQRLERDFAIKIIRPHLAGDQEIIARFEREAQALAAFQHPNVVGVTDYGELPAGGAYLVMELAQGESLRTRLERSGRLAFTDVCAVGAAVADALAAATELGIVHRDLTPDNIFVRAAPPGMPPEIKLLDFGVARMVQATQESSESSGDSAFSRGGVGELTRAGAVIGTPGYMAPEQAIGAPVDTRADLYGLGAVLWELVTGRRLWEGRTALEVLTLQLSDQPPRLDALPDVFSPPIPEEFCDLVDSLLARQADDRIQSAVEVRTLLARLALGAGDAAHATPRRGARALRAWRRMSRSLLGRRGLPVAALPKAQSTLAASPLALAMASEDLPRRESGTRIGRLQRRLPRGLRAGLIVLASLLILGLGRLTVGHPDVPAQAEPPGSPASPTAEQLESAVSALATLHSASDETSRVEAARTVLGLVTSIPIPDYAVKLAALEVADGCRELSQAIGALANSEDPRARVGLELMAKRPRKGCGPGGKRDCLACVRDELSQALADRP